MWCGGGNTRILRKRSRVRFPHSANICVHEHVISAFLLFYWPGTSPLDHILCMFLFFLF
jgi:hypothetical protein